MEFTSSDRCNVLLLLQRLRPAIVCLHMCNAHNIYDGTHCLITPRLGIDCVDFNSNILNSLVCADNPMLVCEILDWIANATISTKETKKNSENQNGKIRECELGSMLCWRKCIRSMFRKSRCTPRALTASCYCHHHYRTGTDRPTDRPTAGSIGKSDTINLR